MVFNYNTTKLHTCTVQFLSKVRTVNQFDFFSFYNYLQLVEKNEGLLKENKILKEQLECLERTGSNAAVSENKLLDNLTMKNTIWEELLLMIST